jgi:hypothetical protein
MKSYFPTENQRTIIRFPQSLDDNIRGTLLLAIDVIQSNQKWTRGLDSCRETERNSLQWPFDGFKSRIYIQLFDHGDEDRHSRGLPWRQPTRDFQTGIIAMMSRAPHTFRYIVLTVDVAVSHSVNVTPIKL